jgi:hypothetical protein
VVIAPCTSCTADALTRANILTNLFVNSWSVDGEINQASVEQYCAADDATKAAFVKAVDNTEKTPVDGQCFVDSIFSTIVEFGNILDGEFQSLMIYLLCSAEEDGKVCVEVPCDIPDPVPDPCALLDDVGLPPRSRALEADQSGQPFDMKSHFKSLLKLN